MSSSNSPIIILSHPQMGENIGSVARVMSNFGLTELRIINPRDGWPNPKAYELAANGSFILDEAKLFSSLERAIADLNVLYGTASISRFMVKPTVTPKQAVGNGYQHQSNTGFLFGCERSGLSNEELVICDAVIKIPTSEINSSLNIAQAVAIIGYEYFTAICPKSSEVVEQPAKKEEINILFKYLEQELEANSFFKSPKMQPTMMRNIKNLFIRTKLTEQDVKTLFGIFRTLGGSGKKE